MSDANEPRTFLTEPLAWAVLGLSVALTLTVWHVVAGAENVTARADFEERSHDLATEIAGRLHDDEQILRGAGALVEVEPDLTSDDWHHYVSGLGLKERYPGTIALGFAEWRTPAGSPIDSPTGSHEAPPARSSIVFLESVDGASLSTVGVDLLSNPVRLAAAEHARDSGESTLVAGSTPAGDAEGNGRDALLLLPVYRRGAPMDTAEARRAALNGLVFSTISLGNLVQRARWAVHSNLALRVFASPNPRPETLQFESDAGQNEASAEEIQRLDVLGSPWCFATREPSPRDGSTAPKAVLVMGLLLSVALFIVTWAYVRRRRLASDLARSRRASDARFRTFFDLPLLGTALSSPGRGWLAVNDRMCELMGRTREELLQMSWSDVTHPDDLAADVTLFDRVLAGESNGFTLEKRYLRPDGTTIWARMATQCVRGPDGKAAYFATLVEDIGPRKLEEQRLLARVALVDHALGNPVDDFLRQTLETVNRLTGCDQGVFALFAGTGHPLAVQAHVGVVHGSDARLDTLCEACVVEGRPVFRGDMLAVAVVRSGCVVAVLGAAGKSSPATEADGVSAAQLAELAWSFVERARFMERISESNARFASTFHSAPVMMTLSRVDDGTYLDVNARWEAISGFSREEALGRTSVELGWISEGERDRLGQRLREQGRVDDLELTLIAKDGRPVVAQYAGTILSDRGAQRLLSIAQDVTAERSLQREFEHAQKMESVGRLAGGVAHDFNNMLAVIGGYTELLLESAGADSEIGEDLEEIRKAVERSSQITRQLLAFARRQVIAPKVLFIEDAVTDFLKMLRRLIGEDIDLVWAPTPPVERVRIDPSQVDQVLANLCVNARDAIDGQGTIHITVQGVTLDVRDSVRYESLKPGRYVRLSVRDTGSGIDPEVAQHIFEPFFTTKDVGRGTGLGLATVYGIAHQNGGGVELESTLGAGATFHVYLPAVDDAVDLPSIQAAVLSSRPMGDETVLLVEDEPAVLKLCIGVLGRLGYRVLAAGTPNEALRLAAAHVSDIQLLVSDVVMPEMSGPDLASHLIERIPGLRCLFMSAYRPDTIAQHGLAGRARFIEKPFAVETFGARVRETLDRVD